MDDKLLKFVKLIDAGSYTKASRELHISQPALTMAIAKLEKELKAELVVKGERPLKMTEPGKVVYQTASDQLLAMDNLRNNLALLTNKKPDVRIGMIDSIAAVLSQYGEAFDRLEHVADISLVVNNSRFLQNLIADRKLDLALVVERFGAQPLQGKRIGQEPMVLVCAPTKLESTQLSFKKHTVDGFISYDQDSMTYRCIESGLREFGLAASPKLNSTYPEFMMHMAARGKGLTVLPYLLVRDMIADGTLAVPRKDGKPIVIYRPFSLATLQTRELPDYLHAFIIDVQTILQGLVDECAKRLN